MIGGYTPDNPLSILLVGYYEGDKLIFVSKVRNGFVTQLRGEVWSNLRDLKTGSIPRWLHNLVYGVDARPHT